MSGEARFAIYTTRLCLVGIQSCGKIEARFSDGVPMDGRPIYPFAPQNSDDITSLVCTISLMNSFATTNLRVRTRTGSVFNASFQNGCNFQSAVEGAQHNNYSAETLKS
eukprot:3948389-Pleurochrysis_carterae.AAC.1